MIRSWTRVAGQDLSVQVDQRPAEYAMRLMLRRIDRKIDRIFVRDCEIVSITKDILQNNCRCVIFLLLFLSLLSSAIHRASIFLGTFRSLSKPPPTVCLCFFFLFVFHFPFSTSSCAREMISYSNSTASSADELLFAHLTVTFASRCPFFFFFLFLSPNCNARQSRKFVLVSRLFVSTKREEQKRGTREA